MKERTKERKNERKKDKKNTCCFSGIILKATWHEFSVPVVLDTFYRSTYIYFDCRIYKQTFETILIYHHTHNFIIKFRISTIFFTGHIIIIFEKDQTILNHNFNHNVQ